MGVKCGSIFCIVAVMTDNVRDDAASFGFAPGATGLENTAALQRAVDQTGTIVVSRPGTYKVAGTVYIGSNTTLICGNNVFFKKVDEQGPFTHVLLNKGALTKTYDEHIIIEGLHVIVNGIDVRKWDVYGLHGQIAFFYIRDLSIHGYRCMDIGKAQYGIHVCTFEDIVIDDVIIKGDKDGVHLGRGKRFTIRNGVFQTYDDAVALNAHDYSTGNPELGWIEDGLVENCHDLTDEGCVGYFCRILAGGWVDWHSGMQVQQSDTVVSNGRLYRVYMEPDGRTFHSTARPAHAKGSETLDGIHWRVVQDDVTYTAGVRNVTFRSIFLRKARIGFSIHFDNDRYSRSYYPGAPIPRQEQLHFDDIRVLHTEEVDFLNVNTPVDVVTVTNSRFGRSGISFHENKALPDYQKTVINITGCVFNSAGTMNLLTNAMDNKEIFLKTSSNVALDDSFTAKVISSGTPVVVDSDLPGLRPKMGEISE